MRGLLVVNPNATSTTERAREVVIQALSHQLDLTTVMTDHRGHASEVGAKARADGVDLVIVFGGDGTVNELINGMLADYSTGDHLPRLAVVPGGSANVFVRSLGLPNDAIEATGELISAIRSGRTRTIGLGQANGRWFCCNAGLGLDAEVVAAIDAARARGKQATPSRYLRTSISTFFAGTDRRVPHLTVTQPGEDPVSGIYLAIIQNTSPWTYLGSLPANPCPDASFETGLDLWAVRSMSVFAGLKFVRRMMMNSNAKPGKDLLRLHDQSEFTIECGRPTALQIDGEWLGDVSAAVFKSHPGALAVIA